MLLDRKRVRFWQKWVFAFMAVLMFVFILGLGGLTSLRGCGGTSGPKSTLDSEIASLRQRITASPGDLQTRLDLAETLRRRAGQAVSNAQQRDDYLRASADAYEAYLKRLAQTKGTKAEVKQAERLQIAGLEDLVAVYRTLNDFQQVTQVYGRLTDLRPNNASYFYDMGRVAITAGDTNTALLAFARFLELDPKAAEAAKVKDRMKANASRGDDAVSTDFSVESSRLNGSRGLISLRGEVDIYTAPRFKERLIELLDEGATGIVVDLSGVTFIDSTALGVLIGGVRRLHEVEGRMALVVATRPVERVLTITGLDRVFTIHSTREAAVAALD